MFNFHPSILYIYMTTWVAVSSGSEQIRLVTPQYDANLMYRNIPPAYDYTATTEVVKYLFTFDSVTTDYAYIDFGWNQINHQAVSRSNYPNRIRRYNKGKLVDNTFFWYSYQEIIDKNKNIISTGGGGSEVQLNYAQSDAYVKYYWICV